MLHLLAAPPDNDRSPLYMERALAAIHQSDIDSPLTLHYGTHHGEIGLFVRCEEAWREQVLGPIMANYPECSLSEIEPEAEDEATEQWNIDLALRPELFPILRHAQFEDLLNGNFADPITSLLRAIKPEAGVACRVEITVAPARLDRRAAAIAAVQRLDREFFRNHRRLAEYYARYVLSGNHLQCAYARILGMIAIKSAVSHGSNLDTSTSRLHEREEDLQAAADKVGSHLYEASIRLSVRVTHDQEVRAEQRLQGMVGAFGAFTKSRLARFEPTRIHRVSEGARSTRFLLSHEELATLWHPPTATVQAERMKGIAFAELEGPTHFSEAQEGSATLGRLRFREDRRSVTLALEDRRRHLAIIGKTGMGKTTLLQNMIVADMEAGAGLCVIDPHGDLADTLLGLVPTHRTNDVISFDAGDRTAVVSFNPLSCRDPTRIDHVTSGVVSAFKKLHDSWGPRLEDTLRNAVFACVESGGNLLSVMRLLGEKPHREQAVTRIRDEVVRSFWLHEFASWSDHYRTEAVAAIQNKIRPFLTNTLIRAIVSGPGESLDLRSVMDEGRILIVNLSKGRIGEDNSTLLGAFLVSCIQQAAMTRADVSEASRRDFFLYVDEFQNFTTGSFATVLSEARKYRLSLIVAHQYLAQLDEQTAGALWGNVGSLLSFQVGSDDAAVIARQFCRYAEQLKPEHLTGLPKYTAYARLLINGMPTNPFSLETLPPSNAFDSKRAKIVRTVSQRKFGGR